MEQRPFKLERSDLLWIEQGVDSWGISDEVIEKIKNLFFETLSCNVSKGMASIQYLHSVPPFPPANISEIPPSCKLLWTLATAWLQFLLFMVSAVPGEGEEIGGLLCSSWGFHFLLAGKGLLGCLKFSLLGSHIPLGWKRGGTFNTPSPHHALGS